MSKRQIANPATAESEYVNLRELVKKIGKIKENIKENIDFIIS